MIRLLDFLKFKYIAVRVAAICGQHALKFLRRSVECYTRSHLDQGYCRHGRIPPATQIALLLQSRAESDACTLAKTRRHRQADLPESCSGCCRRVPHTWPERGSVCALPPPVIKDRVALLQMQAAYIPILA